jgi:hypothetical protein
MAIKNTKEHLISTATEGLPSTALILVRFGEVLGVETALRHVRIGDLILAFTMSIAKGYTDGALPPGRRGARFLFST